MTLEVAKDVVSNGTSMLLYGAIIALCGRIVYDWLKGNRTQKDQEIILHIRTTCSWLREEHERVGALHKDHTRILGEIRDAVLGLRLPKK